MICEILANYHKIAPDFVMFCVISLLKSNNEKNKDNISYPGCVVIFHRMHD